MTENKKTYTYAIFYSYPGGKGITEIINTCKQLDFGDIEGIINYIQDTFPKRKPCIITNIMPLPIIHPESLKEK